MTIEKSTWGGKRPGTGRKLIGKTEPTLRITVRLPQSQHDWLAKKGNVSDVLRKLIQDNIASERTDKHE